MRQVVEVNLKLLDNRFDDRPRSWSDCMTMKPLVCLVDDAADYRLLVETIFTGYLSAYSLRSFASGQAFLDALPQLGETPNLVLLDQHMPPLSGYQTLVALKGQPNYQSIPVVMMSADASHSEMASFYQAGAATFFAKPMDFTSLKEVLLAACQYASKHSESRNNTLP